MESGTLTGPPPRRQPWKTSLSPALDPEVHAFGRAVGGRGAERLASLERGQVPVAARAATEPCGDEAAAVRDERGGVGSFASQSRRAVPVQRLGAYERFGASYCRRREDRHAQPD